MRKVAESLRVSSTRVDLRCVTLLGVTIIITACADNVAILGWLPSLGESGYGCVVILTPARGLPPAPAGVHELWPLADSVVVFAGLPDGAVLIDLAAVEAHVVLTSHVRRTIEIIHTREGAHSTGAVGSVSATKAAAIAVVVAERAGPTVVTSIGLESTGVAGIPFAMAGAGEQPGNRDECDDHNDMEDIVGGPVVALSPCHATIVSATAKAVNASPRRVDPMPVFLCVGAGASRHVSGA
jgi:hypothetical protein